MQLTPEVLTTLRSLKVIGQTTTMPPLDRKLYVAVNTALELLGGKWNRSKQRHVWDCDPNEPLADAVATGQVRDWRKEYQFYETPPALADRVVAEALVGTCLLEPSAGHGALFDAVQRVHPGYAAAAVLLGCELNPQCADVVARKHPAVQLARQDFLTWQPTGFVHCIVMNPPFNRGQDIAHVRHAYDLLIGGGRLTAITSPGWTFRTDAQHTAFRDWFNARGGEHEALPANAFRSSGTDVSTVLLTLNKN